MFDYTNHQINASCLIQGRTDDSFYFPSSNGNQHTGYAADGNFYSQGELVEGHAQASWFTEYGTNPYRGDQAAFPTYGLVLLSPVSLTILDQSIAVSQASALPLWMLFVLGDFNGMGNNFDSSVQGFLPSGVCYADGVISVTYTPDYGNAAATINGYGAITTSNPVPNYPIVPVQSSMILNIDFILDTMYIDVAVGSPLV